MQAEYHGLGAPSQDRALPRGKIAHAVCVRISGVLGGNNHRLGRKLGNSSGRKSTSGGITMHRSHCVKSWRNTCLVAQCSSEPELCGVAKATSEAFCQRSVLHDLGKYLSHLLYSDASAVLGIIQRRGQSKMRHINRNCFFVQPLNADRMFQFAMAPVSKHHLRSRDAGPRVGP